MYKIYMDESSYNYLREWSEEYKRFVKDCPPVASKFQIICQDEIFETVSIYITVTRYGYKFNFVDADGQIAKGKLIRTPNGENDFSISFNFSKTIIEDMKEVGENADAVLIKPLSDFIEMHCNAFIMSNAFLMYGNVVGEKDIIATGRNEDGNKVIVFRRYQGKLYAVPARRHRSPEGIFEVRGHFRKYKSGKIVWIDNYLKGTDKEDE